MRQKNETPEIVRNTMLKKVNIVAQIPIRTVYPPIYGTYSGIVMSPSTILKCLTHKAYVEEILPDGSTVKLTMKNYNSVNSPQPESENKAELENRKSAVINRREDTRDITMKKIQTHTAPIPESHYLYSIKDKCDSEEAISEEESVKLDNAFTEKQSEQSTNEPSRELSSVDTETGEIKGESL